MAVFIAVGLVHNDLGVISVTLILLGISTKILLLQAVRSDHFVNVFSFCLLPLVGGVLLLY